MKESLRLRTPLYIFLLMAMIYIVTAKGHTEVSDTVFSLRTAVSIVERGYLSIYAGSGEDGWVYRTASGRTYSKYGIGLALLFTPFALAAKALSAFVPFKAISILDFLASFYSLFFGALACAVLYRLARGFDIQRKASIGLAVVMGLCTLCWYYSVTDFSEATQMFFLMASIYCLLKNSAKGAVAASILFAVLILIKVANLIYLPVFIAYISYRDRSDVRVLIGRLSRFILFPALTIVILAGLNGLRFGNILETGYGKEVMRFSCDNIAGKLAYILFLPEDGLFSYSPALILGVIGFPVFFRQARPEAVFFAALVIINVGVYAMWHAASHRFIVPVIPLLILPAYAVFRHGRIMRMAAISLIAISFIIQLAMVVQNRQEYPYGVVSAVAKADSGGMHPKLIGMLVIMKHKVFDRNNIYSLSEFGLKSKATVDTSSDYYTGPDLWYCYLARKLNMPAANFVPILFLPFILACAVRLCSVAGIHERGRP